MHRKPLMIVDLFPVALDNAEPHSLVVSPSSSRNAASFLIRVHNETLSVVSVRISTARVSSSAERLVICRLPSCCQTLGRNLGVTRFPSKVTTAKRDTAIGGRPVTRCHGRYQVWL